MLFPQNFHQPPPSGPNRARLFARQSAGGSYHGLNAKAYFCAYAAAYASRMPGLSEDEIARLNQTAGRAAMLVQLVQGLEAARVIQPKDRLALIKSQLHRLRKELEDEPVALGEVEPEHCLALLRLLEADPVLPLVLR